MPPHAQPEATMTTDAPLNPVGVDETSAIDVTDGMDAVGLEGIEQMLERPEDAAVECAALEELFVADGSTEQSPVVSAGSRSSATDGDVDEILSADELERLKVDGIEALFEPPAERAVLAWEGLEEFFDAVPAASVDYAGRFDQVIAARATEQAPSANEAPLPSVASLAGEFQKFADEFHAFAEGCRIRTCELRSA
jgi:hypothetical protein